MGGIQQIEHRPNRMEGSIHQIQRREAARRRYHPDQIYDPNNPWRRRQSSSSTYPPSTTEPTVDKNSMGKNNIMTSDGTKSFPEITESMNVSTEEKEITLFEESATTPNIFEDSEGDQSTQSWRTYFPLPDEGRRGVTPRIRPTRWPDWVTQHDRPTTRPQKIVPNDQITKRPNWVTQHDRPPRWPEWISQSDRPGQGTEESQKNEDATERITQRSHSTRDFSGEAGKERLTDLSLTQRSWNSESLSTEPSFQSHDRAWHFVLMRRPGAEPPTFSSSFYKDRDLRLVGDEEEEGFKVAEGQKETRARHNRRIPQYNGRGHQHKHILMHAISILATACPSQAN